jgi:Holliday junction resolvase RusA-like endonuclease
MLLNFVIPGKPVVLKRHRTSKWGNMYDPSKKHKEFMAIYAIKAMKEQGFTRSSKDLRVTVVFNGLRSNSDLDNAIKMFDAFNGILWDDDKQIMEIRAFKKVKVDVPGTAITVETIES